jgi:DNA-binding GntR family transcriptional regulator
MRKAATRTVYEVTPVKRENLSAMIYSQLRAALMEGRFWPGYRIKIRELAAELGVSETPVREALMQLVVEGGFTMDAGRSIVVSELSCADYVELRDIRLELEAMAAERATARISTSEIKLMKEAHAQLVEAEATGDWREAVRANYLFHHTLYRAADMPHLMGIIENIWLRNGPLLNYLYPHAKPTYAGRHQHLHVLEALRARSPAGVRQAIRDDMIEGGQLLVKLLQAIEAGEMSAPPSPTDLLRDVATSEDKRKRRR